MIGRELGNYVVRSLLGEGGMGAVYAGEHRFLGTKVAIKLLHGTYANNDSISQRFFQEAKSSIEIGHPNIIRILDFGQTPEGALYLVMELLEGQSLGQALTATGPFREKEAARLCAAVCDALDAAHQKEIVHRDLKPDNIFLTATGEVKVLDFGIAKVANAGPGTKTGSLMGTPVYMAPEQCRDSKLVGPHTDVYAMGCILFEMVAGRPPFTGEFAELLASHLFETPPQPSSLVAVSPEMERIILQALEKNPQDRPPGMAVMRDRLLSLVTLDSTVSPNVSLSFRPPVRSGPSAPTVAGTPTAPMASPTAKPVLGRRRAPIVPIIAATLIALGVAGWLLSRRSPEATPPPAEPVVTVPAAVPVPPAPAAAAAVPVEPAAAAPAEANARVVLRSEPAGATVLVDGKPVGSTPALLSLPLPKEVHLTLEGYRPAKEVLLTAGETLVRLVPERKPSRPAVQKPAAPAKASPAPVDVARDEGLN